MSTSRSMFRLSLSKSLLVCAAVSLIAWTVGAQANTIYSFSAQARTIAPGSGNIILNFPNTYSDVPLGASGSYDPPVGPFVGCCAGSYAVSGSATDLHGGTARASASGDGVFTGSTLAQDFFANPPILFGEVSSGASVTTDFQVVGPSSLTPIPVFLEWKISASSTGSGSARADLLLYGGCPNCTAPVFYELATSGPYGGTALGQDGGLSVIDLLPNEPYRIISTAGAADSSASFSQPFNYGTGSAFVDPLFSLPDGYGATYHFVGLPTGPGAPIPEPSVMILLIAGLVAFGFTRAKEVFAIRA